MQMYIIIFLNFVTFHMLKYMEFNLVTEKINLVSLFNIILIYFFAIYNKKVFKSIFYIHPASLFVLITLIVYNSLVLNKLLLTLSIFLFVLFFVLDYKYNAIKDIINE